MIRRSLLLLPALAGCEAATNPPADAAAVRPIAAPGESGDRDAAGSCPLTVRFGSYAMGIDRNTLQAVEALLAADPSVRSVERWPWGREGEITLCARVAGDAEAERLARAVASLFPADPRGPLLVATSTGLSFRAPR